MSDRMKILIVSRGIPSKENPMSGIFEWDQARALKAAGVEVTFVVLDLRSLRRRRPLATSCYRRDGINVVYGSMPLGAVPAPMLFHLGRWKLRGLLKKAIRCYGRPDLIHAHFTDIGAIAAIEAKRLEIPCVITEHSSAINRNVLSGSTKYWGNRAYSTANAVIAVSSCLKQQIEAHFGVRSEVIHNIVDISTIKFSENETVTNKSPFLYVAVGNLLPLKGHNLLISSFAEADLPSDSRLIIIGDGPERENLQRQIANLGLQERITIAGRRSRAEISNYLGEARCFVLASKSETFGVVYIEAMLAGVPVIATRCGGPEDFVDESCGILIDPGSGEQLTAALQKMNAEAGSYNRRAIHDYAAGRFAPEVIARQIVEVYNSVLK